MTKSKEKLHELFEGKLCLLNIKTKCAHDLTKIYRDLLQIIYYQTMKRFQYLTLKGSKNIYFNDDFYDIMINREQH